MANGRNVATGKRGSHSQVKVLRPSKKLPYPSAGRVVKALPDGVLNTYAKLVFLETEYFDRGDQGCFASAATIGGRLGLNRKQVDRARARLLKLNLLTRIQPSNGRVAHWFPTLPDYCTPDADDADGDEIEKCTHLLRDHLKVLLREKDEAEAPRDTTAPPRPAGRYHPAEWEGTEHHHPAGRGGTSPRSGVVPPHLAGTPSPPRGEVLGRLKEDVGEGANEDFTPPPSGPPGSLRDPEGGSFQQGATATAQAALADNSPASNYSLTDLDAVTRAAVESHIRKTGRVPAGLQTSRRGAA